MTADQGPFNGLIAELRSRAEYYRHEGPSAAHTATLFARAAAALQAITAINADSVGMTTEGRNAPKSTGEGEAPVALKAHVEEGEWGDGPMLLRVNDRRIIDGPTDKIADAAQRLNRLFANTRPTPATPEGLREAVERLRKAIAATRDCSVCDGDGKVQRHDPPYGLRDCGGCDATGERHDLHAALRADIAAILSALQPQAQPAALSPESER